MQQRLGNGIVAEIGHGPIEVKKDSMAYRVIVNYVTEAGGRGKLIKEYFVWASREYVEDFLRIRHDARFETEDVERFALQIAQNRYLESGGDVPAEEGVAFKNGLRIPVENAAHYDFIG